MRQRYKFVVSYVGNKFSGSQSQPRHTTVQGLLEEALARFAQRKITAILAGRTDTGVHALGMAGHFDLERVDKKTKTPLAEPYPASVILRALNANLVEHRGAILVTEVQKVPLSFHARFSAARRTYHYLVRDLPSSSASATTTTTPTACSDGDDHAVYGLHASRTSKLGMNVFDEFRVWQILDELDLDRMREAAALLRGRHDFSSFRSSGCSAKYPTRTIDTFDIDVCDEPLNSYPQAGRLLRFRVSSEAFLYHQIRNMVGALVEVGRGTLTPADLARILSAKDRTQAPAMAPPDGLYFAQVDYPQAAYQPLAEQGKIFRAMDAELLEDEDDGEDADGSVEEPPMKLIKST